MWDSNRWSTDFVPLCCGTSDIKFRQQMFPCFKLPLCTYRLNWARIISWGWWDEWDDTALQTQDSKFEPWRFEAEHALGNHNTEYLRVSGEKTFVFLKLECQSGGRTSDLRLAKQAALTIAPGPRPDVSLKTWTIRPSGIRVVLIRVVLQSL